MLRWILKSADLLQTSQMIKTRTNSLTDMLSHGQFTVEDAEDTHNIGGRDRIRSDM